MIVIRIHILILICMILVSVQGNKVNELTINEFTKYLDTNQITELEIITKVRSENYEVTGKELDVLVEEAGLYLDLYGRKMHDSYLRFSHKTDAYFSCTISGTFEGFYPVEFEAESDDYPLNKGVIAQPADDQGYLVFATVSDDFEKYHAEAKRFIEIQESSQISDIYLRDNIYTNISNGLGIFAAKAETWMVWSDGITVFTKKSADGSWAL